MASLPSTGFVPSQAPDAVQLVASAAVHDRLVVPPLGTSAGFALKVTTGAVLPPVLEPVSPMPPQAVTARDADEDD